MENKGSSNGRDVPELHLLPREEFDKPLFQSLVENLRETFFPKRQPPLVLTSKPATPDSEDSVHLLPRERFDRPMLQGLFENIREALFPKKLPPLVLTSKPAEVKEIWGAYDYTKKGAWFSAVLHVAAVVAIVAITIIGGRAVKKAVQTSSVQVFAPDISDYVPLSTKKIDTIGGGGGGGDRDKLVAPKGKLPKLAMEQITPPAMVIRNDNPKLPVEPTVVVPPQVKLPMSNAPNFGDPKSALPEGPASNGTGSGGGIGSGSGGGVGSGSGPGVGPGYGGGIGGGVFKVGGGVSAPRALDTPDPDYSEEARKAKYQGVVVLWMIVGADGRPRDVKIARSLGMGLDQKAIEAVRRWKFEPALKDGKPVAVQINVEVNFRLY
jgi:TonB family protein